MVRRSVPALVIAALACAGGKTPAPSDRPAAAPLVLQGAAAVAANRAALRAGSDTTPAPCAVAGGTIVAGRVIDDSTGLPLADVGVSAVPGCVVQTNAAGEYKLGPLGGGHFRIMVDTDTRYYLTAPWVRLPDVRNAAGTEISVREIRVRRSRCVDARPLAHVAGLVVDDSLGAPMEQSHVQILSTPCGVVTAADGRFRFAAPGGRHTLAVRRFGYSVVEVELDLAAGDTTELHVRMRRAGTFLRTGLAQDVPGRPGHRRPADSAHSP